MKQRQVFRIHDLPEIAPRKLTPEEIKRAEAAATRRQMSELQHRLMEELTPSPAPPAKRRKAETKKRLYVPAHVKQGREKILGGLDLVQKHKGKIVEPSRPQKKKKKLSKSVLLASQIPAQPVRSYFKATDLQRLFLRLSLFHFLINSQ